MTFDTHVHSGGKYAPIEEWQDTESALGLSGAVLVQNMGNTDNSYLQSVRMANPDRYAIIAIPADLKTAQELLEGGASGFRLGPRGLHDAPNDHRIFDVLETAGAVASITAPFEEMISPDFAEIIDAFPRITFRLEHLGTFAYGQSSDPLGTFQPILNLASRQNVTIMWSGYFVFSGQQFPHRDAWPLLEATLEAFGPERIMWSGDWNRAGGTLESYAADLSLLELLPFVSEQDATRILSTTPSRVFGFGREGTLA